MGLLSSIGKGIAKGLDVLTVSLAHPIQTATAVVSKKSTVQDVVTAHFSQPLKEQVKDIVLGTAGIAATVVGGAAVSGAAKAGTLAPAAANVAKSLIPTTVKGKVIAAVAAPIVVGAVSSKPVETLKAAVKAPTELGKFGADIATFAADPSLSTGKQLIQESPLIAAAAGLVVAGGAAKVIAPAIGGFLQKEAIEEQTQAIRETGSKFTSPEVISIEEIPAVTTAPTTPVTPATQSLSTTQSKRKKRRASKAVMPSISQRVNVIVSNRQSQKYIKERIYA